MNDDSLSDMITGKNPELFEIFKEFSIHEHSYENIDFLLAVNTFKTNGYKKKSFTRIIAKFFIVDAYMELNVPSDIKNKILTSKKSPEIFDDCYNYIMVVVNNDVYKRFLQSELYHNYKTKLKKSESLGARIRKTIINFFDTSTSDNEVEYSKEIKRYNSLSQVNDDKLDEYRFI